MPCSDHFLSCPKHVNAADKAQTGERSRNIDGTLSGADRSTASDAELWNQDDVYRCFAARLLAFATRCGPVHPTAGIDVVQANGLQLEMCICTWHISLAHSSDKHDIQADRADLALL